MNRLRLVLLSSVLAFPLLAGDLNVCWKELEKVGRPATDEGHFYPTPDLGGLPWRTFLKARAINKDPFVLGRVLEIGAGFGMNNAFRKGGYLSRTLLMGGSHYAQEESEEEFNEGEPIPEGHVSEAKLRRMLSPPGAAGERIAKAARRRAEKVLAEQTRANPALAGHHRPLLFTVANTVATVPGRGRGWVGIRFETISPDGTVEINTVVLHVRMLDANTFRQDDVLGILGVNLTYAALQYRHGPNKFVRSLFDDISRSELVADSIVFEGPAFERGGFDSVVLDLELLRERESPTVFVGFTRRANGRGPSLDCTDTLYNRVFTLSEEHLAPDSQSVAARPEARELLRRAADAEGLTGGELLHVGEIEVTEPTELDLELAKEKVLEQWSNGFATIIGKDSLYRTLLPFARGPKTVAADGIPTVELYNDPRAKSLSTFGARVIYLIHDGEITRLILRPRR